MGRHRTPARIRGTASGTRRAPATPRLRYRRVAAVAGALVVTSVAVLGGIGVLPTQHPSPSYAASGSSPRGASAMQLTGASSGGVEQGPHATDGATRTSVDAQGSAKTRAQAKPAPAVPANSGSGKRVVLSIPDQRVWLVDAQGKAVRTYLVSGSLTDNLRPGSYHVYAREPTATGIDNSGTMEYFVVFTSGQNAAIGFHDIPHKDGKLLQTRAQLGTPQSHGCVRQWLPDAKALWAFAPLGTSVVVV